LKLHKKHWLTSKYFSRFITQRFSTIGLFQTLKNRTDELNSFAFLILANTDGEDEYLNEIQSVILYRIINELINNTIKHAKASQANIDLIIADENVTLILKITE
jgi:signal transduction histidine kinase